MKRIFLWVTLFVFGATAQSEAEEYVVAENNAAMQTMQSNQNMQNSNAMAIEDSGDSWTRPALSWLQPSDANFYDFISPMTNPVYFEDPRTLSELRTIFIQHQLPGAVGGHSLRVLAVQARAALTENLSVIAVKDGYVFADPGAILKDGFADVSAGLKYNLYKDLENQRILSTGFTYAMPVGSTRALQGRGAGEYNAFLSYGQQILGNGHWLSVAGFRLPGDHNTGSTSFYWSNHFDKRLDRISNRLYAFTEFNYYHWIGSGAGGVPGVEGLDFFNLGSTGVTGNSIVTGAMGAKIKTRGYNELGIAYEVPLSARRDVISGRLTIDWIVRF